MPAIFFFFYYSIDMSKFQNNTKSSEKAQQSLTTAGVRLFWFTSYFQFICLLLNQTIMELNSWQQIEL